MSDSMKTAGASKKKRKHQDEDAAGAGATKRSKTNPGHHPQNADGLSSKERTDTAGVGSHKSSNSSRRRAKRIREKIEREKVEMAANGSTKASLRKAAKERSKGQKKRRKGHGEGPYGLLNVKQDNSADNVLTTRLENVEDRKADKEARRQPRAVKKARKASKKAQDVDIEPPPRQDEAIQQRITQKSDTPTWTITDPSAGRFVRHDPIFVHDENGEQFLVSANSREMQVLSLETSLVLRTFPDPGDRCIKCFALDALNANVILIAYEYGPIVEWSWTDDLETHHRSIATAYAWAMDSAPDRTADKADLFYVSIAKKEHCIFKLDQKRPLYSTSQHLNDIRVLGNAEYLVCFGPSTLVIGKQKDRDGSGDSFAFVEIPLSTTATCFDAQLVRNDKKGKDRNAALRLALGYENGQIHLYDDLSSLFSVSPRQQRGEQPPPHVLPTPRILHWHREAASSVKFSRDGNYLISGGRETVLVIWQLETGKKQFLPHLGSEIDRIVVNPEGDRYAVQLGDNSIMVLSTSELKPIAHFAGLQMICPPPKGMAKEWVADRKPVAAVLHPKLPSQLLVTVPSSPPKSQDETWSRPFLQTFDTRYSRHVSRQALTRNNVTDFNLGPERTPILPPDVVHMAISHDGTWLATVDEWMPPHSDLEHLQADDEEIDRERERRREVYLKIWHWDEQQGIWTLSTRADAPHARANGDAVGAGAVLGLESDPTSNAFATIGEDGCVKLWKPRKRKLDADLIEWRCTWSLQIPRTADSEVDDGFGNVNGRDGESEACMAFSEDGSLLAVSITQAISLDYVDQQTPLVHFIDTFSGTIAATKSNLAKTAIRALGFLGRHFIAVTLPAVYVSDLVEETLVYKVETESIVPGEHPSEIRRPLLAVNSEDDTFAIVVDKERVEVYGVRKPTCLFKQEFEAAVGAVLSVVGKKGFVLLFEHAEIRTVLPSGASSHAATPLNGVKPALALPALEASEAQPLEMDEAGNEMEDNAMDLSASPSRLLKGADAPTTMREHTEEDDRPVVRPEHLANIFDVPHSFAMPPVKDMFSAVVGLFGRKPLQTVQT